MLSLFHFIFLKENYRSPWWTIGHHPLLWWCSGHSALTWTYEPHRDDCHRRVLGMGWGPCFLESLPQRWSPGRGGDTYRLLQVGAAMACLLLTAFWVCAVWQNAGVLVQKWRPPLPLVLFMVLAPEPSGAWQASEHKQQVLAPVWKWHIQGGIPFTWDLSCFFTNWQCFRVAKIGFSF